MNNDIVADIGSRFVNDPDNEVGLCLEAIPTGFGKTHQNLRMMLRESLKTDNPSKFFFITNLIKNIPYQQMMDLAMGEFGLTEAQFRKHVLFLKSNIDMFRENYRPEMRPDILSFFKEYEIRTDFLTKLLTRMNAYATAVNEHSGNEIVEAAREKFQDSESDFRGAIRRALKKYKDKRSKLDLIHSSRGLQWIADLYPAVDFDEYMIVMMSDAKFLYPIDTLVSAEFTLWLETDLIVADDGYHSRLRERVLVVDEFDTFKGEIEKMFVEEKNNEIDYIVAFRNCCARLPFWKTLPAEMLRTSDWWKKYQRHTIEERFSTLIDRARAIKSTHHTEFLFKLFGVGEDGGYTDPPGPSFMFKDYEPYTIGNAFTLKTDDEERYNVILAGNNITAKPTKISNLIGDLKSFFEQLSRLVRDLAYNLLSNKDSRIKEKRARLKEKGIKLELSVDEELDSKSLMNQVYSIVDALDFEPDLTEYVAKKVAHNRMRTTTRSKNALAEPTFYSRGFSYINMRDSFKKQLQTHLYQTEYDTSPEYVVRHISEVTKLIGLSATAAIESPLCNFNLKYLKDVGVHFHKLSKEEGQAVYRIVDGSKAGFREGRSTVHSVVFDIRPEYSLASWEDLFDEPTAEQIYEFIGMTVTEEENDYAENRYVRATRAVMQFAAHPELQSMICFFSAHVKNTNGHKFHTKKVNFLLKKIARKMGVRIGVEWADVEPEILGDGEGKTDFTVFQINGSNFDAVIGDLKERLAEGERILIITAYQTLGAGQNLQHLIPLEPDVEPVWVKEGTGYGTLERQEKDIDAIYLDDPKSVGPIVENEDKASLDHYLFYAEYIDSAEEITIGEKEGQIAQAFHHCHVENDKAHPKHFKNTESYLLAKAQIVIQSMGRIGRTGWKNPHVYVFLDPNLAYGGTFAMDRYRYGKHLSYEFEHVYDCIHNPAEATDAPATEAQAKKDSDKRLKLRESAAVRVSHNLIGLLDDIRYALYGGEPSAIRKWRDWRKFVLHHPTGPKDIEGLTGFSREAYQYGYVLLPEAANKYWFTQKKDFLRESTDGLEIKFDGIPRKRTKDSIPKVWQEVSSAHSKLDLMLRIPGVEEFLKRRRIPTSFKPSERLMSPPLFRNVYMGALGETVGKFLIQRDCGLKKQVLEMPDKDYEQFDYRLKSGALIDFKDWNEFLNYDSDDTSRLIKHIAKKMDRCGAKRVYVINICVDGKKEYAPLRSMFVKDKEIIIVPCLYDCSRKKGQLNDEAAMALAKEAYHE